MARLLIIALAVAFALGGIGAAVSNSRSNDGGEPILLDTVARKDGAVAQVAGAATDDDDDDDDGDTINGTFGNSISASGPSQVALLEGRTAAQWMASARLYEQRWLQMKRANHRHGQQVRNLRASIRPQVTYSPAPRVARGGDSSGGGGSYSGGGDT